MGKSPDERVISAMDSTSVCFAEAGYIHIALTLKTIKKKLNICYEGTGMKRRNTKSK